MAPHEKFQNYSDRLYGALLHLYPVRFRRRFSAEMIQIFRDCCRGANNRTLLFLWTQTFGDILLSIPKEWLRDTLHHDGAIDIDYTGMADTFMITLVAGTNLIAWGIFSAFVIWRSALMILPMAVVTGTVFGLVAARTGRIQRTRIT